MEGEKMKEITNYKIQITNNAPVYKKGRCRMTMSKITNPIASMHPCIHAISFLLTFFSQLPIFPASLFTGGIKWITIYMIEW